MEMLGQAKRNTRLRKAKVLPDFEYDSTDDNAKTSKNKRNTRSRQADETTPSKRLRVNVSAIKTEVQDDEDSAVLSTDSLVEPKENREPKTAKSKSAKSSAATNSKPSLRALMAVDVLTLDHLEYTNQAILRDLFADLKADELSRQFIYYCKLQPGRCKQSFKSFGNENKARLSIERHLRQHIDDLLQDAEEDPSVRDNFSAVSIAAIKRKIEKAKAKPKPSPKSANVAVVKLEKLADYSDESPSSSPQKSKAAKNKPVKRTYRKKASKKAPQAKTTYSSGTAKKKGSRIGHLISSGLVIESSSNSDSNIECGGDDNDEDKALVLERPSTDAQRLRLRLEMEDNKDPVDTGVLSASDSDVDVDEGADEPVPHPAPVPTSSKPNTQVLAETESLISRNMEMIEKIQGRLKLEKQPYKDHSYPLLMNRKIRSGVMNFSPDYIEPKEEKTSTPFPYSVTNKSTWEHCDSDDADSDSDDVIHHDLACHYGVMGTRLKTGYSISGIQGSQIPIVQLVQVPRRQDYAPAVGEEVVIEKSKPKDINAPAMPSGCIVESESDDDSTAVTSLARPYPPMPKYQPELGTKLIIPEEEMITEDIDQDVPDQWDLENPDHVKRYAILCMRELKLNRGLSQRNCTVACKICSKNFTAAATLMYHYRSHANIKPFVCLLCNATFTRQHSLNYHMLIHNGTTRFKCPDCGRAFRHPSHFKEHQRRHTGEQPYHCPACPMKFKTRNSYKRHCLTKHEGMQIKIPPATRAVNVDVKQREAAATAAAAIKHKRRARLNITKETPFPNRVVASNDELSPTKEDASLPPSSEENESATQKPGKILPTGVSHSPPSAHLVNAFPPPPKIQPNAVVSSASSLPPKPIILKMRTMGADGQQQLMQVKLVNKEDLLKQGVLRMGKNSLVVPASSLGKTDFSQLLNPKKLVGQKTIASIATTSLVKKTPVPYPCYPVGVVQKTAYASTPVTSVRSSASATAPISGSVSLKPVIKPTCDEEITVDNKLRFSAICDDDEENDSSLLCLDDQVPL